MSLIARRPWELTEFQVSAKQDISSNLMGKLKGHARLPMSW